jgi:hypothetical protein
MFKSDSQEIFLQIKFNKAHKLWQLMDHVVTKEHIFCFLFTVCFADLDQGIEIIIFESIFTTLEASFIFRNSWGSIKNWLQLKIEPPLSNLACLNW